VGHLRLCRSLHGYRRDWLTGDVVAGLRVWAVLVPESLAYPTIAGRLPGRRPVRAPGALLLYAAFGSSRHLVVGPMSATTALSAGIVGQFAAQSAGGQPRRIRVAARPDFVAAVAAMIGVLAFDTLPGLVIGIGCSLVLLAYRASSPHVAELARTRSQPYRWTDVARHPGDELQPGIVVLRVGRACSPPTPTTSARRCLAPRDARGRRPSSSTPRRCPSST
jgi:MFS superfamily sulfate permease-like transporter